MTERLFLLNQPRPIYEGPTTAYWATGASQSLPPPVTPNAQQQSADSKPAPASRLSDAEILEIRRLRHAGGFSLNQISRQIGRSFATVKRVLDEPKPVPEIVALAPAVRVEPQRTHVIDWSARMAGWKFEDDYKKPRPRRRLKMQILERHAIGQRWLGVATQINPQRSASKLPLFK
jgi:lambda repressor-like predicted transcriptional regulator